MKTLRRISKNRAFTHIRILAAVLLIVAAAALVLMATSPPAAAQRDCAPAAADSKDSPQPSLLTYRLLSAVCRAIARPLPFAPGTILEVRPERRKSEGLQAHRVKPDTVPMEYVSCLTNSDHPRSVADFRRNVEPRQLQHLWLPGEPAGPDRRSRPESLRRNDQSRLRGL